MRRQQRILLFVLLLIPVLAFSRYLAENESDHNALTKLIERSYIHGAFMEMNVSDMRAGFQPAFHFYGSEQGALRDVSISEWLTSVERRKTTQDRFEIEHKIISIDITGTSALAKVEIYQDGSLLFTDYLTCLKFTEGWKIMSKVYHRH